MSQTKENSLSLSCYIDRELKSNDRLRHILYFTAMFAWSPVYLPSPVIYLSVVSFWAADILTQSRRGSCEGSCEFSHRWTTTCRFYLTGLLFSSLLGCFTLGLYVYTLSSCFSMRWWPLWSKYNISDTRKRLRQQPFGCVSHSGMGTSAAHAPPQ